jgi:hypothetical protein
VKNTLARLLLLLFFCLAAAPLPAQGPEADWRVLETASYRFFYPAEAEDFTRHAASRLEAVRERVAAEVGYKPEGQTEVMVVDPLAGANGSALPLQGWGRLILFTTPPGPDSVLGFYDDWVSDLILHEEVHLAHLLRPSRRPLERKLGPLVPLGPLIRKSPTWATEGYATYLEGKMTGFGRPNADLRPSLMRRWAQQGYLPSYGELSGAPERFMGGSFPYLVGSAFLEWLVEREGEDSLRHLWARLSAASGRSFDDAFSGVFGEKPEVLYRRFCAELTHQAMLQDLPSETRGGDLWLDLSGRPSVPVISPDGASLAIVERAVGRPAKLVVYATKPDEEAAKKEEEQRQEIQQRDPEDVLAVRRKPLPPKKLRELEAVNGGDFSTPRFFAGGKALLLSRLEPQEDGRLIPDLYRFEVESGELRRLTHGAGLRDADPLPDDESAIALRYRWGKSELIKVALDGGGEEEILEAPHFPEVLAQPRVSPDGSRLAMVVHRDEYWRLEVRPLDGTGLPRLLELPPRALVFDPAWSADGKQLYATVGSAGRLELYRFDIETGRGERLTREPGAAYGAAPGKEAVFFLALEWDGFDLRRVGADKLVAIDSPVTAPENPTLVQTLVARKPESAAERLETATLPEGEPYGGGPLELLPLIGGGSGPDGPTFELGLRAGDPVGRREALLLASAGEIRGAGAQLRWRGRPWRLGADLFGIEEKATSRREETERHGVALHLSRQWESRALTRRAEFGAAWQNLDGAAEEDDLRIYGRGRLDWRQDRGEWRFSAHGQLAGVYGELDPGGEFHLLSGSGRFEIAYEPYGAQATILGLELGAGEADGGRGEANFELGGRHGSLVPAAFHAEKLESPGLAANILAGDQFERARADLQILGGPLRIFGEKYRFDRPAGGRDEIGFWGLEIELEWPAQPYLRAPAGNLRAGALEILEGPLEDEIELYLSVAWRP